MPPTGRGTARVLTRESEALVTLSDGTRVSARLLVAAWLDGVRLIDNLAVTLP